MRLIDADALKKALLHKYKIRPLSYPLQMVCSVHEVHWIIDNAPTIEITDEQAYEHLAKSGWLMEHDTAMIEKGMERQRKLTIEPKHFDTESWKTTTTDLPLVKYAPVKHGRWIEEGLVDGNQNRYCRCSECGKGDTQAISQRVPYCWWCGAKMDLDEVEE